MRNRRRLWLVAAVAGASVCAGAVLAATRTPNSSNIAFASLGSCNAIGRSWALPYGPTGVTGPDGRPRDPIELSYNRTGGTLRSVDVTVRSRIAGTAVQLDVLHVSASDLTRCDRASRDWPKGFWVGRPHVTASVVYRRTVRAATPRKLVGPTGRVTTFTWSGRLSPNDWKGGCQSAGAYVLRFAFAPGSVTDATFGCRAS